MSVVGHPSLGRSAVGYTSNLRTAKSADGWRRTALPPGGHIEPDTASRPSVHSGFIDRGLVVPMTAFSATPFPVVQCRPVGRRSRYHKPRRNSHNFATAAASWVTPLCRIRILHYDAAGRRFTFSDTCTESSNSILM